MADPNTPAATPAAPAPAAAPAAAAPAAAPAADPTTGQPFATFHTKDAFDDRVDRAARAKMRELGVDPEQAKKDAEELAAMKAAEEKRRAAEMSELERAQAEAEKLKAAAAEAEARAVIAGKEAETAKLAAAHRVADLKYLAFRLADCPDDADRDEWLGKLLEDPKERVRFGLEAAAPASDETTDTTAKATTSATPRGGPAGAPQPPKTGGTPEGSKKGAMGMTAAEFAAHKRATYGAGGRGIRRGYKPPPR